MPQDYAEAESWYRKAAEQGYASAQYSLGVMYREGRGVPKDDAQAATWFTKAAEQGVAKAQFKLGNMYKHGIGVPKTILRRWPGTTRRPRRARLTLSAPSVVCTYTARACRETTRKPYVVAQAADKGLPIAQYDLGMMYVNGNGVARDYVQAYMWMTLATVRTTDETEKTIFLLNTAGVYARLTKAQVAEAEQLHRQWLAAFAKKR